MDGWKTIFFLFGRLPRLKAFHTDHSIRRIYILYSIYIYSLCKYLFTNTQYIQPPCEMPGGPRKSLELLGLVSTVGALVFFLQNFPPWWVLVEFFPFLFGGWILWHQLMVPTTWWWQLNFLPRKLEKMNPPNFDEHIFSDGLKPTSN